MQFELKLADGKVVTWSGASGEDASARYVDCRPDAAVVAWRNARGPLVSALTRGCEIDGSRIA